LQDHGGKRGVGRRAQQYKKCEHGGLCAAYAAGKHRQTPCKHACRHYEYRLERVEFDADLMGDDIKHRAGSETSETSQQD
jgi:hypothetical protein